MPLAAVDIGTNSVRMLIADYLDGAIVERERQTTVTGLGVGVDTTGQLAPKGIRASLSVLAGYADRMTAHQVARVRIVATSASRDAANGPDFLARVTEVMNGIEPSLVSGVEEARLAFAGAAGAFHEFSNPLVVDIGGGSTEFVTAASATSVDVGSVRLTDRALPDRPALAHQVAGARQLTRDILTQVKVPPEIDGVIGVAGTWTSVSAIAMDLPSYDRSRVHGSMVSGAQLERLVHDLAALSLETTQLIPSLDAARAPAILGGSIVALESAAHLGGMPVIVSEHDLLDGVIIDLSQ